MTELVDAQVHAWSRSDDPRYPWDPDFDIGPLAPEEPVDQVIEDMNGVGVDAAILAGPSMYASDNSYGIDAARRYPDRLALVARPDYLSPDHKERLAELYAEPTVIGIRMGARNNAAPFAADGVFEPMFAAAEELGVPVCTFLGSNTIWALDDVAQRHPDLKIVVDHLSLDAPPWLIPEPGPAPFERLPDLLALAKHANVYPKLTAIPALSNEPYPFRDIWDPVLRVVDAFGAERVMWGTDYNRTSLLHTYQEAVDYLKEIDSLDDATRETLYSRSVRLVFDWPPERQPSE